MLTKFFRFLALVVLAARKVKVVYKAFMHRHVENVGLLGSLGVVLGVSYGLYLLDPQTPTLSVAMLQVIVLAPVLLFVALSCTTYTYKHLLPEQFRQFVGELGNKLNQVVLPPVEELLPMPRFGYNHHEDALSAAEFKLKYSVLKFKIRCTRFVLYGLPFGLIFYALVDLLKFALNLQPH